VKNELPVPEDPFSEKSEQKKPGLLNLND